MNNLTIFFVTNNYKPYSSGIVSSIDATVNELRKIGHTVYIIALDFDGAHRDVPFVIRLKCPIKFTYRTNPMAIPFFPATQIERLVQRLKPDLIHVHHPFLLGPAAYKVAQRNNLPTVFTYHTLYEQYSHFVPLPQRMVKAVARYLSILFSNKVDGVVAPSGTLQHYLLEHGVQKPIAIIPSGILPIFLADKENDDAPHESLMTLDQELPVYNKPFNLLTVSRFSAEKNISFLIHMFSTLDQTSYRLTLVGYGAQLDELKQLAYEKLLLSPDCVRFIEKPDKASIAQMYKTADLFVFASQSETQGLVIYEAMAGGAPVVALVGPGQNDVIENGVNGYLVNDQAEMAATIINLATHKEQATQLRIGARQTAQRYTAPKMAARLLNFYQEIRG